MKFVEFLRVDPELQSSIPVVESIPIECQQDLAMACFGEMSNALFDAFLFEGASNKQQLLYRLNPRLVNAEDAGPIPIDDSADVHPRQTIHVDQAQHFTLLRIRQPLDRRPHRQLLAPEIHPRTRHFGSAFRRYYTPNYTP